MAINYKNSLSRYRRYLAVSRQQPWMRASLYVVLSLLLVIVLLVSALRPTLITIAGLLGQIEQNRKIEKTLDEKIAEVRLAEEELQRVEPRLGVLDEAVPSEAMWGKFVGAGNQIETDSGIILGSMAINPAVAGESGGGLARWGFTISGKGGYANAKNFISQLERMRRIVVVKTIDIVGATDNVVTVNMAGDLGFLPEEI